MGLHRVIIECKNCGAPLHKQKCEYCGSVYGPIPSAVDQDLLRKQYEVGLRKQFENTGMLNEYLIARAKAGFR